MKQDHDEQSVEYDQMDEWLKNYFLDPLTSYFDHSQFRIDMYETERDWIVEAILSEYDSSEITVYIHENSLTISALRHLSPTQQKKVRTIDFPFQINNKKALALFSGGILEILISKTETEPKKNKYLTLP